MIDYKYSYSALTQLYADDVQAYLHCSASDAIATTQVTTFIMGALEAWMSSNRLRLNSAKTQFIWLGTRQQLARLDKAALSAAFPLLTYSSAVRDLSVTLDCALFPWWVPRSGMGSLLNFGFSLEPCHLRFFSHRKTALFSRAGVGIASE